ncbi:hypothetical protein Tco_0862631 [Tanacetum coccineum]
MDKTLVQKNSFPVAWRILFTFVIQALGGNYSSTEQVNSIQQLLAYCRIIGTEVDIGETIYSDLVTKLFNKPRLKYVSYPRFISCDLHVLLDCDYTQEERFGYLPAILSNSNFTKDLSKVTNIELTAYMINVNNQRDSVSPIPLSAKLKKGKSQTVTSTLPKYQRGTPIQVFVWLLERLGTPTLTPVWAIGIVRDYGFGCDLGRHSRLFEGPEASEALSKKRKKPKSKKTPTETKATSTPKPTEGSEQSHSVSSGTGTHTSQPFPEGTIIDPKDSVGNKQPIDKGLPSTASDEGTAKTTPPPEGPLRDKDSEGNKTPVDMEPIHTPVADPSGTWVNEEDILGAGEEMDEDPQAADIAETHHQITEDNWEKHEEATVNYNNLKASIDEYYDENISHRDQTDKLVEASMSSLDKSRTTMDDLYKGLNVITALLKDINNAVKDDPASTVKDLQAHALKQNEELAAWAKSSTNMAWNLGSRISGLERAQNHINSSMSSLKEDTHSIKSMMTEMYEVFKGQSSSAPLDSVTPTLALTHIPTNVEGENATNTATEDPPSHTEGETNANKQEKPDEPKHLTYANIEFITSSIIRPNPDALIPYTINGEVYYLTVEQLQAQMDKKEKIKKAEEEARLFAISKPKVIKVVREEAKKLGIHPKEAITTKAGEKFKKAQDAEHEVLKRQHTKKVRKSLELRKHKYDNYMWTIISRLKPETITDIKIHLKTKSVVITVFKGTDGRNFDVHKPFAFGEFGISELDELREIIPKKKNAVVKDLMNSLAQRYERIRKIPEELEIKLALPLPAPAPEQAYSKSSRKKRKQMELEPKTKIPGLECNRALPENVLFVNNMVIEEPKYGIFLTDEFGDQAFQRWSDINKVAMEALVSYLVVASMVQSPENARFNMKLKKLIAEHPDQEKLK